MKIIEQNMIRRRAGRSQRPGFTMVELLVGSSIMLIVIVATLALYARSNKVAVDQNMYAELQHDVRSAMYLMTRDVRMAGVGLPAEYAGFFLEGTDNEIQGGTSPVQPDRLLLMGNIEDPINLRILQYQGSAAEMAVLDGSFEQYPYPDDYYEQKLVVVFPSLTSGCIAGQIRTVTHITHDAGGTNERMNFSPGLAPGINPPGGLADACPNPNDFDGGTTTFIDVVEYWLDQTGNYAGLSAGVNGYIGNGEGDILYMTINGVHYPLAQNVENLQFEYCGDLDNDGNLDGFLPWQVTWSLDEVSRIRQIRMSLLARTPRPFISVSGNPSANLYLYQRPALSNDPAGLGTSDRHKRFLLESTSNIRNLSVNIYNTGAR